MSHPTPDLEFVDDPVEITTTTTLRKAVRSLGIRLGVGRKLERLVMQSRAGLETTEQARAALS